MSRVLFSHSRPCPRRNATPASGVLARLDAGWTAVVIASSATIQDGSAPSNLGTKHFPNRNDWQFGDYLDIGTGAHSKRGFELQEFMERTGLPMSSIAKGLDEAQAKGLIRRDLGRVVPTERGFDFLSDLLEIFPNTPERRRRFPLEGV